MDTVDAKQLVDAVLVENRKDDDEDMGNYLIDKLTEAAAANMAALDEVLKATEDDERTLL